MKVSVVIPTYNRPGLALNLAKQIKKYEPNAEIIIVDQSDQKEDLKEINKLKIKYLENSKVNTSIAKNLGLTEAAGDIVIFFDDDVEILKDTISSHLAEYSDTNVLGVAGRVINDGENVPSNAEVETGRTNKFLTAFTDNFWSTRKQFVQFPYGCNMSFRNTTLKSLGGFDRKIPPPGFEEYDLGLRVAQIGKIIFSPKSLVYHHRAQTGGHRIDKDKWFKSYYWTYGRMIKKHVPFAASVLSVLRISLRIVKEYPLALPSFYNGFITSFGDS